jgi:hypothetical protein
VQLRPDGMASDVLICGHGRRDRCCGALGTSLAMELTSSRRLDATKTRIWRTSHTGGHRFAPTVVILPEATAWAFVDSEMVDYIVRRVGSSENLLSHYRGCSALTTSRAQVLERAVFAEIGWSMFSSVRKIKEDASTGIVRLFVESPTGTSVWEAVVSVRRHVTIPTCGTSPDDLTKSEPEWAISDLRRVE